MITNSAEFSAIINMAVQNALEVAIELAYEDLQKCMDEWLYGAYSPVDYGDKRTYALKEEWIREVNSISASIQFEEGGTHQSFFEDGYALGNALLDVLESGYRGYNAKTGRQIPARPFFEKWIQRADKEAHKWVKKGLIAQGLTVLK